MKITLSKPQSSKGFTLIEMIGVLAVIAILASLLIPKVFEAINNARVNNAAVSIGTIKTAVVEHYAKYGSIPVDGSVNPPDPFVLTDAKALQFDQVLLAEQLIDKPFSVKIGDGVLAAGDTCIQIRACVASDQAVTGDSASYDLDGSGSTVNDVTGSVVIEALISGVLLSDAQALNKAIDGSTVALGPATDAPDGADIGGRVKYAAPAQPGDPVQVYVYLTHR